MKRLILLASIITFGFTNTTDVQAQSASNYYENALSAYENAKFGESYIHLKNALNLDDSHMPAKLLMGKVLLIDGYTKDAITEFREVLQAGADKNLVVVPLGHAYLQSGRYQDAIDLNEDRDYTNDVQREVSIIAATAYSQLGSPKLALSLLQSTLDKFGPSLGLLNAYANIAIDLEQYDKASQRLAQAVKLAGNTPQTLQVKGKLLKAQNQYQQALNIFEQALELSPRDPVLMRSLAATYAEMGEYKKADKIIERIEKQSPNDILNRLLKARVLALTNQQTEADAILRQLSELFSVIEDTSRYQRAEVGLIAGIVAYINRNYELAYKELKLYLADHYAKPNTIAMLINSAVRLGQERDALKLLENYPEQIATSVELLFTACNLYIEANRSFKCTAFLDELTDEQRQAPLVKLIELKTLMTTNEAKAFEFAKANLWESKQPDILRTLAILSVNQGDIEQGIKFAFSLVDQTPNDVTAQLLLIDLLIRTNDIIEAENMLIPILNEAPSYVPALIHKVRILVARNRSVSALEILDAMLLEERNNVAALQLAAQITSNLDKPEDALNYLVDAKVIDGKNISVRELLVSVYIQLDEWEAALAEVNQLLSMNRLSLNYLFKKVEILIYLKREKEASEQLRILSSIVSDDANTLLIISELQTQITDYQSAAKTLQQAVVAEPNNQRPRLAYVRFLVNQQDIKEAQLQLNLMTEQFGQSANSHLLAGDIYSTQNALNQALSEYALALGEEPKFVNAYIRVYELSKRSAIKAKALALLEKIWTNNQGDTFYSHLYADALFLSGQNAQAKSIYTQLLPEDIPNKFFILNNLALISAGEDKVEQGLEYAEQAVEMSPNSPSVIDTYGWLLSESGKSREGLDYLRRAYVLDATAPLIHYHLAKTLIKLNRRAEALQFLEDNNTSSYDFEKSAQVDELMEELKRQTN